MSAHSTVAIEACANLLRTHRNAEDGGALFAECSIGYLPGTANAEHLALCWNSHDTLVATLRAARAYIAENRESLRQSHLNPRTGCVVPADVLDADDALLREIDEALAGVGSAA